MKKLVRLAILVGLAIWAWRRFAGSSGRSGASRRLVCGRLVRRPRAGSVGFERLASIARAALRP